MIGELYVVERKKVPLDNNIAERHLRSIAIGRKNFLFVATCQLHGVNPETYLADVLVRVQPDCDVEPLMPWNWSPKAQA